MLALTDAELIKFGVFEKVENVLKDAKVKYMVFSEIQANPTVENVKNALKALKKSKADVLVAVGGGSVIDTAKAVSVIATNPDFNDVVSLDGTANTKHKGMPLIACPTTAGTAAEVTINYVITDTTRGKKWFVLTHTTYQVLQLLMLHLWKQCQRVLLQALAWTH